MNYVKGLLFLKFYRICLQYASVVCLYYFIFTFNFSVDMVEHTRLESLLELALRTSAAKAG